MDLSVINETSFFPASIHHFVHKSCPDETNCTILTPHPECFIQFPFYNESKWSKIKSSLNTEIKTIYELALAFEEMDDTNSNLNLLESTLDELENSKDGLELANNFFTKILPEMKEAVLDAQKTFPFPLPLLKNRNQQDTLFHSVTLSRRAIFTLMSMAFFDILSDNFSLIRLLKSNGKKESKAKREKLKCFLSYFDNFCREDITRQEYVVTFYRKLTKKEDIPDWKDSAVDISPCMLFDSKMEFNKFQAAIVDFANSSFGGGTLGTGTLQEEVLLCQYTEATVGMLFFHEELNENEAALIFGAKQINATSGYADTFAWIGSDKKITKLDENLSRFCCCIIGIDADNYSSKPSLQLTKSGVDRELLKAFTGFQSQSMSPPVIATGKWGCGAFQGDTQLKLILQLIAASFSNRQIHFHLMGDQTTLIHMKRIIRKLIGIKASAGLLYSIVLEFCKLTTKKNTKMDLFTFIEEKVETISKEEDESN